MNTVINSLGLFTSPRRAWEKIAKGSGSILGLMATHTVPLALLPAVCWYFGVTRKGWSAGSEVVLLTKASALPMFVLFFLAMIYCVLFLGFMVHWMAKSYNSDSTLYRGIALITYAATPFFVAGILGLWPILWLDIVLGIIVSCYCIYLLYLGTPFVMRVSAERGFLFSSAVFAVALVAFVALLGATVILWSFGPTPEYIYVY